MNVIWRKVWYDLWQQRGRTLLAVLSIAAGVFAIGSIFGMVDQLLSGMDAAHRAVSPSHVNVILRTPVDADTAERLEEIDGVTAVDRASLISVRYKLDEADDWSLGSLVMRPDYDVQTNDVVSLREGGWPGAGDIGVERLTSQHYAVSMGDEVIFDVDGEARTFPVEGVIRHPFVEPPTFGGQAHFFADAETLAEFGIPEGLTNQLLVRVEPYSLEHAQEVAGEIRQQLSAEGATVAVMLYQDPDEHWGRMFVEGVTVVLQVMAVVSLFLSVFLVLTTLTAVITQQTNQIGVIKALGGRSGTIIKVYLAGVLVYGGLALLLALPLGALAAYGASRWFLNIFNIDYEVFQFSTRALVLQVIAALVVPLLAALWPVLRGASISVREAIATYGIGADFGTSFIDRTVKRLGARFLSTPFAAALGNVFRRKERLSLTLLALTTAGVMFMVVMSLITSITLTLDNEIARREYDIRIGFVSAQDAAEVQSIVEDVAATGQSEMWLAQNATLLREGEQLQDSAGLGAQLTGIPDGSTMLRPVITAGSWLEPDAGRVIVMNEETAEKNNIDVDDVVTLNLGLAGEAEWQVVGTYKLILDSGFITEAIYAPLDAVQEASGRTDTGTQVYIQTPEQTDAQVMTTADELQTRFEAAGMDVDLYTTANKFEERDNLSSQFTSSASILQGLAMLMASVGAIGLAGSLGISVVERRREIGVMRAIGAKTRTIRGLFIMEGALQGIISWLVAVPLAFVLARPLSRLLGQTMLGLDLDYAFNLPAVFIWLGMVVGISVLAAVLPARSATRVSVRESLAYE